MRKSGMRKICPICNQEIVINLKNILKTRYPGRHIIRCPNCGKLIRKKRDIRFVFIAIALGAASTKINEGIIFEIIFWLIAIFLIVFQACLPYEPYEDRNKR